MLTPLIQGLDPTAKILLTITAIVCVGYLFASLLRLIGLPRVTGYLLAGLLLGPALGVVDKEFVDATSFLSDLCLSFVAFGVGRFFKKQNLRKVGKNALVITLLEALLAQVLVTLGIYFLFPEEGWPLALLLGALATATAPASTLATIGEYHGHGPFVDLLLSVVALDDVVCLLSYSLVTAFIGDGSESLSAMLPLLYTFLLMALGGLFGYILSKIQKGKPSLLVMLSFLFPLVFIGSALGVSSLLSAMAMGGVFTLCGGEERIFDDLTFFSTPLMLVFFVRSGASMDVTSLSSLGLIGLAYFILRLIGKYGGAYLGCRICHLDQRTSLCLGLSLAPQAGVALGLSEVAGRLLEESLAPTFQGVILASSFLYELFGPSLSKMALLKTGSIKRKAKQKKQEKVLFHYVATPEEAKVQRPMVQEEEPLYLVNDWRTRDYGRVSRFGRSGHHDI